MRTNRHTLRILVAALLLAGVQPSAAHHTSAHDQNPNPPSVLGPTDILHFEAGSLIIPMDGCYQRPSFMSDTDLNQIITPLTEASARCNSNAQKDDGIIPAYSLVFRLVAAGIPVSWSIRNGKSSFHDIDFSIVRAGGAPVRHYPPGGSDTNRYAAITTVRYRGAPFVIDAAHATAARLALTSLASTYSDYRLVDVHVAQVGFDVPVYRTVDTLPKLAIIDVDGTMPFDDTDKLAASVDEAVMADLEGTLFDWLTVAEVNANALTAGDYDVAWVPPFELPAAPSATQLTFMNKLSAFTDAGGAILLQDGAIAAAEGYGTMNPAGTSYTATRATTAGFQSDGGVVANGVSSAWDNGNDSEAVKSTDYSDPASQFGGIVWTGIGGSKYNWKPRYDRTYLAGVRRMIYSDDAGSAAYSTKDGWDFATWRHKDNDPFKGVIYYLGGYNWRRVTAAGFRVLLNTLLANQTQVPEPPIEVSRSAPIVAIVNGIETEYTGTYEAQFPPEPAPTYGGAASNDTFEFPHVLGHVRGLDASLLSEGSTSFDDAANAAGLILFDAADQIPPVTYTGTGCAFPANGLCRRIFTETGDATAPTRTPVAQGNVATLKPLLGSTFTDAEANVLIARIHAGVKVGASYEARLGGIDRSTMAVIEQSPLVPNGRATMAYVGGLDGMLHAICAEPGPGCPEAGVELWAFMPSTELSKVATNTTRIDGSPKVADVFGDFGEDRAIRTVLTFQTGNENPSAVYALDVTDPTQPTVLWRHDTSGPGINNAIGWVRDASSIRSLTFAQYASGTDVPGFHVVALDTATGETVWTYDHVYPAPRSGDNPEVPTSAMPGGASLLGTLGGATVESVLVPSLWGAVYKLDAQTGENEYGSDPLFKFDQEDFHPIGASVSVYRDRDDGLLRGLIVTGGFADPFEPTGSVWAPDDVRQYAVGFPLDPGSDAVPVTKEQVALDPSLGILIDFGEGQRAFSPAVIAGNEVFITTDTSDVNSADFGSGETDSGRLWRQSLSGGAATFVAIPNGAASVDVSLSSGAVFTGGGNGVQRTDPPNLDAVGTSTEVMPERSGSRRLWLRLR